MHRLLLNTNTIIHTNNNNNDNNKEEGKLNLFDLHNSSLLNLCMPQQMFRNTFSFCNLIYTYFEKCRTLNFTSLPS